MNNGKGYVYEKKDKNRPGSIWKITNPIGEHWWMSTVEDDEKFLMLIRTGIKGNSELQKSVKKFGFHKHKIVKEFSNIPRKELTTRKRELVLSTQKINRKAAGNILSQTPEEFKPIIEELMVINVALYDSNDAWYWKQIDGVWTKVSDKKKWKRVNKSDEPEYPLDILNRMEEYTSYLQMSDGSFRDEEQTEEPDELEGS
jgi:hypothetical protein